MQKGPGFPGSFFTLIILFIHIQGGILMNEELKKDFRYLIKQKGGMFAKGRLLGIQFDTLFTDELYFRISRHAIEQAMRIKNTLKELGIPLLIDSPTNQQFPILKNSVMEEIKDKVGFCYWEKYDEDHTVVRFASSWATTEEDIAYLKRVIPTV